MNIIDNTSFSLKIKYEDTSFLFTVDAEHKEERDIVKAGYDIGCDDLQVAHHGSEISTRYLWLCDADVIIYRTDMQGHIICIIDESKVNFDVEWNPDADTLVGAGSDSHSIPQEPSRSTVDAVRSESDGLEELE